MNEKKLGKQLQQARQSAGLTQQALCQKTGLSYSTLAKIERGAIKSPSIFTVNSIAEIVGVSLDELLAPHRKNPVVPKTAKKQSRSGVRFVYFDINGVLVRFFHAAFTKIAKDTGAVPDMIETTFWRYNDKVCSGEMNVDEFNKIMGKQLDAKHFDWQHYYLESIDPVEQMHDVVAWTAEHYEVGLMSNIMPGFIGQLLHKKLIPDIPYSAIVDSSLVHAVKPQPKMYETAQQMAGVKSNEILLIDDSRSNLTAADKFDWHVLWFDDFKPDDSVARIRSALEF